MEKTVSEEVRWVWTRYASVALFLAAFETGKGMRNAAMDRYEITMKEREREREEGSENERERDGDLITQISLPVCVTCSNYLVHSLAVCEVRFSRSIHR